MMTSRHRRLAILGVWVAAAGPAHATPPYARIADDNLLLAARGASKDRIVLFEHDSASTGTTRRGCPIEVDVVNPTAKIQWNIIAVVQQRIKVSDATLSSSRASPQETAITIPYLLPRQAATIRIPCSTRATNTLRRQAIDVTGNVSSATDLELALDRLAVGKLGSTLGSPIEPSNEGQTGLEAMIALDDPAIARQLVEAVAARDVGVDALLAKIKAMPGSNLARHTAAVFEWLPPKLQAAVARTMLADAESGLRNERLLIRYLAAQCTDRSRLVALWNASQTDPNFGTPRLRGAIAARCRPGIEDLAALETAWTQQPARAILIDDLAPALFAAMLARWKASPPTFLPTYLAAARKAQRFEVVLALVPPRDHAVVVAAFARGDGSVLHDSRLRWIRGVLAAADDVQLVAIARALLELDAAGKVEGRDYAELVEEVRRAEPKVDEDVQFEHAANRNSVFDLPRLAAANIDRRAFSAYAARGDLERCGANVNTLLACARSIHDSRVPGLGDLVRTALKPELVTALHSALREPSGDDIVAANSMATLGWDLGFLAEDLCARARTSRASVDIARAKQLVLARACIERLESEAAEAATVAARNDRYLTIAGILGLILPLAIGVWIAIRWLRRRLPEPEPSSEAPVLVDRDTRLGTRLARGLTDGVARAHRELSITTVGDEVVEQTAVTVRRAVASGVAASRLVRDGHATFYLLALPVADAPSEVVHRHLGSPWPEHAQQVAALAQSAVTALIVLCGPDAMAATLLIDHREAGSSSEPDALLDARDARERQANSFRHPISLAD